MRFSIIIPVFNVAPWLRECLDSVIRAVEKYGLCGDGKNIDVEVVCVDDGSTDGSGEILENYAHLSTSTTFFAFRIVHQQNSGVSAARNAGLAASTGDWILFVDSDDVVHPEWLTTCSDLIKRYPDAQIVRFARHKFLDGASVVWQEGEAREVVFDFDMGLNGDEMRYSFVCNCCHRNVIPQHGFKAYIRGEDLLFRAECLAAAEQMVSTSRCLYGYRTRPDSAMTSPMTLRKLHDRIGYSLDWLSVLDKRPAPKSVYYQIAKNMTEGYVCDLMCLSKDEREYAWSEWFAMLPSLLGHRKICGWYRYVALIGVLFKNRALVWLCCVPLCRFKGKLHG